MILAIIIDRFTQHLINQMIKKQRSTAKKNKKRQGVIIGAVVVVLLGAIGVGSFSSSTKKQTRSIFLMWNGIQKLLQQMS